MFWRRSRRFEVVVRGAMNRLGVEEVIGRPIYFKHTFPSPATRETGSCRLATSAYGRPSQVLIMNAAATKTRVKVFMLPEMSFG